jgi:SAM-dependent methyltransferase
VVVSAYRRAGSVRWHDLECGSYAADLPLWRELAGPAGAGTRSGAVLDIGAGTGRVTLDLARRGHRVTALDLDAELLEALRERAAEVSVETVCADARTFELSQREFAVCLVPMQTIQLLAGAAGRLAFLRRARAHLSPGGLLACAIVTEIEPFDCAAGDLGPSPEIASADGSHYVSRATRVQLSRRSIRIERERSVLPSGRALAAAQPARERDVVELDRVSASQLRREGREAGLRWVGTRSIGATEEHAGSVVVMLRMPRA